MSLSRLPHHATNIEHLKKDFQFLKNGQIKCIFDGLDSPQLQILGYFLMQHLNMYVETQHEKYNVGSYFTATGCQNYPIFLAKKAQPNM